MYSQLAALLGILTAGLLSPGPDFFLIVKNSMSGSRARAFATGWGIAAGLTVQVAALSLGLAAASRIVVPVIQVPVLQIIQMAGVAVLAWIGLKALLARPGPEAAPGEAGADAARKRARRQAAAGFSEGFLCNVTNVKVFTFFVFLFPQFIRADSPADWRVIVPVVVVAHGLVMWTLIAWALMFPPVARQLARAQRWLPRVFGAILVALAVFVTYEILFM